MGGRKKKNELSPEDELGQLIYAEETEQSPEDELGGLLQAQPDAPEPARAAPPKSVLEQLVEGTEDAVSGFTHGATLHNDATLYDLIGMGDQVRARNAEAQNRSPNIYGAAELVGGALPNFISGGAGLVRQGLSGLGRAASNVGAQGLQGMAQGFARGFGDSDPEAGAQERVASGIDNAEREGVLSALVASGASAFGGAAGWARDKWQGLSDAAGDAATSARIKSWQVPSDTIKEYAEREGIPLDEAARLIVDRGEAMVPPNAVLGRTPGQWNQGFEGARKTVGANVGGAIDDATAAGAQLGTNPRGELADNLMQLADDEYTSAAGRSGRMRALEDRAAAVRRGPQITDPQEMRKLKTQFDELAAHKGVPGSYQSHEAAAFEAGADDLRGQLTDYVGQGGPEVLENFVNANRDFGIARTLQDSTANAQANQIASGGVLSNAGIGALGALGGSAIGAPWIGAAAGAVRPAYAYARNSGSDFGANMGRLAERGFEGMGNASGAASRFTAGAGGQVPSAAAPTGPMYAGTTQSDQQRMRAGEARGYLGGQAVEMVLERNPEALGEYADELTQAKQAGNLNGVLYKLFMRDPEFRTRVYPQIQQLTRE